MKSLITFFLAIQVSLFTANAANVKFEKVDIYALSDDLSAFLSKKLTVSRKRSHLTFNLYIPYKLKGQNLFEFYLMVLQQNDSTIINDSRGEYVILLARDLYRNEKMRGGEVKKYSLALETKDLVDLGLFNKEIISRQLKIGKRTLRYSKDKKFIFISLYEDQIRKFLESLEGLTL